MPPHYDQVNFLSNMHARFVICLHHSAHRLIRCFWTPRRKFSIVSTKKGIHKHMSYSQQDSFFMPLILISIQLYLSLKFFAFFKVFFLPFLQRIIMPWNKKLYLCLPRMWLREKIVSDLGFYLAVQILGDYFNLLMFSLDSCFN